MSLLKALGDATRAENEANEQSIVAAHRAATAATPVPAARPAGSVNAAIADARRNFGSQADREAFFRKQQRVRKEFGDEQEIVRATFNVVDVIAYDPLSNWTVLRCRNVESKRLEIVKGEIISKPKPNDRINCFGSYRDDAFMAGGIAIDYGNENEAAFRFLMERIADVGETTARRLKDRFGMHLAEQMAVPESLVEAGVSKAIAEKIAFAWIHADAFERLYVQFRGFNVGPKTAQSVSLAWGKDAVARTAENPWDLYREIDGIGFLTADRIAMSMGKSSTEDSRLDAALSFALDEATQEEGHMWISREDIVRRATEILETTSHPVRAAQIEARFDAWQQFTKRNGGRYCVVTEVDGQQRIYPVPLWNAEKRIVEKISDLIVNAPRDPIASEEDIVAAMEASGLEKDNSQYAALFEMTHNGFSILTGKPGCGKTTITKVFLDLAEKKANNILCCSPTGKAADRFREATGRAASTIHSLIYAAEKADLSIACDVLVVDEASMIDAKLMRRLIDRLDPGTRVVLVGDADQLPPVDPGQPFADLISSGCVPVARLETIHRQAANSGIISAAHAILAGRSPREDELKPDFRYTKIAEPRGDEEEKREAARTAADAILRCVVEEIPGIRNPDGSPFDPIEDAMVLTPRKDGILGTKNLNRILKNALNPPNPAHEKSGHFFKFKEWTLNIGDRVIHTKNNRELGVFNGNVGTVVGFTQMEDDDGTKNKVAVVRIKDGEEGRLVYYKKSTAGRELQLAYAITAHKSQGSEFKAAIVVCAKEHWKLLQRKLVYTALTRGKKFVRLFAQPYALKVAVETVGDVKRNTGLVRSLREKMAELGRTHIEAPDAEAQRRRALEIAGSSAETATRAKRGPITRKDLSLLF